MLGAKSLKGSEYQRINAENEQDVTEWLPKRILHQETMAIDLHSEGGVQQEDSQLLEYTPQGLAILDKFEDQRSLDVC